MTTGHVASLQMSQEDGETKREVHTLSYHAGGRCLFNMWFFLVFFCYVSTAVSLNPRTAAVGESITLHCSHFLAEGNIKYFCRDSCVGDDILIRSETGQNPTRTDRYTLSDEGSDFTVTIADLRLSDSGTYICAVDRYFKDTYNYVTLHVSEVSRLTAVPTSASRQLQTTDITENKRTSVTRQSTADTSPKTTSRSALLGSLVHVGAGLGALVLIFTVAVFIFLKLKYKQKRRSSSSTSSAHRTDLIYTTPNVTAQTDSLNYSSVRFIKDPNCRVKTSETFQTNRNEWTETLYSSVQTQHQSDLNSIYCNVHKEQ